MEDRPEGSGAEFGASTQATTTTTTGPSSGCLEDEDADVTGSYR